MTFRHTMSIISNALVHNLEENSNIESEINSSKEEMEFEKSSQGKYLAKIKLISDKVI